VRAGPVFAGRRWLSDPASRLRRVLRIVRQDREDQRQHPPCPIIPGDGEIGAERAAQRLAEIGPAFLGMRRKAALQFALRDREICICGRSPRTVLARLIAYAQVLACHLHQPQRIVRPKRQRARALLVRQERLLPPIPSCAAARV
jgi:hypothetical protein